MRSVPRAGNPNLKIVVAMPSEELYKKKMLQEHFELNKFYTSVQVL
jgi:hypothetical protein